MKLKGYGEDFLTLCALLKKDWRITISKQINDKIQKINNIKAPIEKPEVTLQHDKCKYYYRPSFGRGNNIGEFDFIILSPGYIFLGESKTDDSKEVKKKERHIELSKIQKERHNILYRIIYYYCIENKNENVSSKYFKEVKYKIPKKETILFKTIKIFIDDIRDNYSKSFGPLQEIKHLLLLFKKSTIKYTSCRPFLLAELKYSDEDLKGNSFVCLQKGRDKRKFRWQ